MANTKQSKKRAVQILVRTRRNHSHLSRTRTFIRKVEEAIATGDRTQANDAFKKAMPEIHRAVTKGVFHRNKAARKLSRLSARVQALD
ncbi:MAG: 30S ribosomal protein S20 [Pseudomonadota bacterium]